MFPTISGKHQVKSIKDITVAEERVTLSDEPSANVSLEKQAAASQFWDEGDVEGEILSILEHILLFISPESKS